MQASRNIYQKNGLHYAYLKCFSKSQAMDYFHRLEKEVSYFSGDLSKIKIYGKLVSIPRQHVAFGDSDLHYTFSGLTLRPKAWTPLLIDIKNTVEKMCGETFNFVLINKYRSGSDTIGFHRDDEIDLVQSSSIASVSLGQQRDFVFKRNGFDPVTISLESGSLLQMLPPTNMYWSHGLPRSKNAPNVRLNLTFRRMKSPLELSNKIKPVSVGIPPQSSHEISLSNNDQQAQSRVQTPPLISDKEQHKNGIKSDITPLVCFQPSSVSLATASSSSLPSSSIMMKRAASSSASSIKKVRFALDDVETTIQSSSSSLLEPAESDKPSLVVPSSCSAISLTNLPPHHFSLGGNKLLVVSEYTSTVRVHIRSYRFDGEFLHPTKYGVTMSAFTFHKLLEKMTRIIDNDGITTINKELQVDCLSSPLDTSYCLQRLYFRKDGVRQLSTTPVSLTSSQFEELQTICTHVSDSIAELQFGYIFKKAVLEFQPSSGERKNLMSDEELLFVLAEVLKTAIYENVYQAYDCKECRMPAHRIPPNQLAHECSFYTHQEKMRIFFDDTVAILDPTLIAKSFLKESGSHLITVDFLNHLNVKELLETTKALC